MASDFHHFSMELITREFSSWCQDFFFNNSDSQRDPYCVNGHFRYDLHKHEGYFDWTYIVKGQRHEVINEKDYIFKPGDLFWIREGDQHESTGEGLKYFNLCGKTAWLKSITEFIQTPEAYQAVLKLPEPLVCHVPEKHRSYFAKEWERCWEFQASHLGLAYATRLVTTLFIDFFFPQVEQTMHQHHLPPWLSKAMRYIQAHTGQAISSEQLADVCGKSQEHVARSFRKYLGQTPSQYINQTRLNFAARLLVTTQMSVLNICIKTGFGSLRHFNHLFKKRFNVSPRTFRIRKYKPTINTQKSQ